MNPLLVHPAVRTVDVHSSHRRPLCCPLALSADAKRDAQESTNRLKEEAVHAKNEVKRAVVGGNEAQDTADETTYHAQHKTAEVGNRVGDAISDAATKVKNAFSSNSNTDASSK